MICYINGQFLEQHDACINVDDRGFNFGDGVYEALIGENGVAFELESHIERLYSSAKLIHLNTNELPDIESIVTQLIELNQLCSKPFFVYIQISRGVYKRNHKFPTTSIPITCFISIKPFKITHKLTGIVVKNQRDTRWQLCNIKSTCLLPNVLAKEAANMANADEAIFIDNGIVTEGAGTNVFAVKDGMVFTHPNGNKVLAGITKAKVIEICQQFGIPVISKPFEEHFFLSADEAFVTGTTKFVTPIKSIIALDKKQISLPIGLITRKLTEALFSIYYQQVNLTKNRLQVD